MQALKTIEVACPLCGAQPGHPCINIIRPSAPLVPWTHFSRQDAARDTNLPDGITSFHPIHRGERRWNGVVWQNFMVDEYNTRLSIIERLHRAGHYSQHEIDALYQLATKWDRMEAERA